MATAGDQDLYREAKMMEKIGVRDTRKRRQKAVDQLMREVEDLARRIGSGWKSSQSGAELVEEQRR